MYVHIHINISQMYRSYMYIIFLFQHQFAADYVQRGLLATCFTTLSGCHHPTKSWNKSQASRAERSPANSRPRTTFSAACLRLVSRLYLGVITIRKQAALKRGRRQIARVLFFKCRGWFV